jgi:hypothetical protein
MAYRSPRVFLVLGLIGLMNFVMSDSPANAATPRKPRTLSIDSGYGPFLQSNRSMHQLWFEYEGLGSKIFDTVSDKTFVGASPLGRIPWFAVSFLGWKFLNYGFFVGNHEVGHGSRSISRGSSPRYFWDGGVQHPTIFSFLLEGFLRYDQRAFASGSAWSLSTPLPDDWDITITAGGMNNSMMFAETLQDEILAGGGHLNQLSAYIRVKTDAFNYAKYTTTAESNDVLANIAQWRGRGYSITTDDIASGAAISALASFSTYAYAWSALRYVWNGDPVVSPLAIGAFVLPDLSFFQNRYGLSYRLRSALDFGAVAFPWSIEYVYKGQFATEVSVGILKRNPTFLIQAFASTLRGGGLRLTKQFGGPTGSLFFLGGSVFTLTSLEGERNLGFILPPGIGLEGWTRWSWAF